MTDEKITYSVLGYGDEWTSMGDQRWYWPECYYVIARGPESTLWYLHDGTRFPSEASAQRMADSLNANPPKVA